MSKETYINLFNSKSEEFFDEIIKTYPQIPEFKKFKTAFRLLVNLDSKSACKMFKINIYDIYKDFILTENETFFLEKPSSEIAHDPENWTDFVDKIKEMWRTLEDDNKKVVWKYFHILIILCEKYFICIEENKNK